MRGLQVEVVDGPLDFGGETRLVGILVDLGDAEQRAPPHWVDEPRELQARTRAEVDHGADDVEHHAVLGGRVSTAHLLDASLELRIGHGLAVDGDARDPRKVHEVEIVEVMPEDLEVDRCVHDVLAITSEHLRVLFHHSRDLSEVIDPLAKGRRRDVGVLSGILVTKAAQLQHERAARLDALAVRKVNCGEGLQERRLAMRLVPDDDNASRGDAWRVISLPENRHHLTLEKVIELQEWPQLLLDRSQQR